MKPTIVVATDFSEGARHASDWALQLADKIGADLNVYHCYHVPILATDVPFPTGAETMVEEGLQKLMREEESRLAQLAKQAKIRGNVEPGFANESINEYAKSVKASYIVMGIAGKSGFEKTFVGSTATGVALHAKTPVFIVPVKTGLLHFKNVAIAVDQHLDINNVMVSQLIDLCEHFDANIDLLHVKIGENSKAIAVDEMKALIEKRKALRVVSHEIQDDSVEHGLTSFTKYNNTDLMVVIHKHHSFLERLFKRSHTGKLALEINVPLLVLQEN